MERELVKRLNILERKIDALANAIAVLQETSPKPVLLPISIAAARLGKSVDALRKQAKRGTIGCHYNPENHRYYFDSEMIDELIKQKAV